MWIEAGITIGDNIIIIREFSSLEESEKVLIDKGCDIDEYLKTGITYTVSQYRSDEMIVHYIIV